MKTFYFIVKDSYDADQNMVYAIKAENEESAQEKFMKYICKLSIDFDNFTDFLENYQDISIYIIDKAVSIE